MMRFNEDQQPQAVWVLQSFQVLPPQPYTLMAQFRLDWGAQGALPPLHCPQFTYIVMGVRC